MRENQRNCGPGLLGRLSRVALASVFVTSGVETAREPGARTEKLEAFGLPQPELLIRLNGAGMAVAGTTLALGIRPRESALALLALLIPTTVVGHPFWTLEGPARRMQEVQFLKNTAMAGGLMALIALES
jgi:putative oxidoreductase